MKTAEEKETRVGRDVRRGRLSGFAGRLLAEWRRRGWPSGEARVVVAVSGGADSTALLVALDELKGAGRLGLCVTVAHLNHGLRGEAGEADARWVEARASALGLEAVVGRAEVGELARAGKDNLEQAARRARYEFLSGVARGRGAWALLTAHTLDDQAETVLLRLMRGSGAEGLSGIRPEREPAVGVTAEAGGAADGVVADGVVEGGVVDDGGVGDGVSVDGVGEGMVSEGGVGAGVRLVRPLVAWARRADTEGYCRERGVEFRADEMNEDERFARVRVRRRLLPLLETFNPRVVEALARTAELLRDDAAALEAEAARLLEEARTSSRAAGAVEADAAGVAEDEAGGAWPLRVGVLASATAALRRRALRLWLGRGRGDLRRLEFVHVLAVERLLGGVRGGRVAELPGGGRVERRRGRLRFDAGGAPSSPTRPRGAGESS